MANKRDLKKGIAFLCTLTIEECLLNSVIVAPENRDAALELGVKVLEIEEEFKKRVNVPDGKDNPKLVKKYYAQLEEELNKAIDEVEAKLASLIPA